MERSDSKGHVLNKDSDWLVFKSYVTGYSRREGAYGILIGSDLRPEADPLHNQVQAAAALPALINAQRVWDMTSSKIWFYIFTFTGYEYQSLLTSDDAITCHAAWMKLVGVFEGKNELSINIALRNVTTLTSQGMSIAKYVADLSMNTQILLSLIPPATTIKSLVEMLQIQTLLTGLPEDFDSLKTQMRATPALTVAEITTRVLNEDAAIRAASTKSLPGHHVLRVGDKDRRSKTCKNYGCPKPKGHLSEECWFKYPELKVKFDSKRREGRKDGGESAKATVDIPSQAWSVKSVGSNVNSTPPTANIVCRASKATNSKVDTLITQTFNMDSACTSTIMNNSSGLVSINLSDNSKFSLADTSTVLSQGTGLMPGKNLKVNIIKSFSENLLSIPQLFEMNYATVFHPSHGIIIANAKDMTVGCSAPLGIGKYENGTFLMDINVGPVTDKACVTGAIASSIDAANSGVSLGIPLAISPILEY
jgi:hypothetical protein